ncbi:hypothetical protein [Aliiglaciecola sp. LCG003]|uniref:hypothetical protein n=1 Tax=Aliiglaciecola sp. LCG003 TaxID=3053655 RepID=UPI002572B9F1|nr:hypothetical protein [Aliiglaciecola sp. LCG003]WJG09353.1 hypothetical protein QR722_18800 [Aliiglaciecola sp. LCG003]
MKTTLIALSVLAASSTAMATTATNYDFVALDNSEQTQLCLVSAKEGLSAAKKMGKARFSSDTLCNGKKIADFAKQYQQVEEKEQPAVKYSVVAYDNTDASMTCVKAAVEGVASLNLKPYELKNITCNGRSIRSFARTYFNM